MRMTARLLLISIVGAQERMSWSLRNGTGVVDPSNPRVLLLLYACWGVSGTSCDSDSTRALKHGIKTCYQHEHCDLSSSPSAPQISSMAAVKPTSPLPPNHPTHAALSRTSHGSSMFRSMTIGRRLTGAGATAPKWVEMSFAQKASYARRHSYDIAFGADDAYAATVPRPRNWGVLRALQAAVAQQYTRCGWVWYVDSDTVITNPALDILSTAGTGASSKHVFMTRDQNGINTGSVLARCTPQAASFFDAVWQHSQTSANFNRTCASGRCGIYHPWNWQLAVMQMMDGNPTTSGRWRDVFEAVPQERINSYPSSTVGTPLKARWRPGHFLVHFAGCGDQAGRSCAKEFGMYTPS